MIKIRLARKGTINKPVYRIVAIDERKKNNGKPLEVLGFWQPLKNIKEIKKDKIKIWLEKGAQLSPAVKKLLD